MNETRMLHTLWVELLGDMMSSPAFAQLRTVEQLGYVGTAFYKSYDNIDYIVILVASGAYNADYMYSRVLNFTHYFYNYILLNYSQSQFQAFIDSKINTYAQPPLDLSTVNTYLSFLYTHTHTYILLCHFVLPCVCLCMWVACL